MKKDLNYFIKQYLENRPMFLSIIRSQEAMFFQKFNCYIKGKTLDFGCGDGFFAETVFGKGKIDVGFDLKNSRAPTAEKNKIYKKVVYYESKKIPFPNGHFQTVISNCVLEHIFNLKQSLKEIQRVLKPDGYFLTSVMTNKWESYLFGKKILGNWYVNYMRKKQEHHNVLTIEQWVNVFKQSGFKLIRVNEYMNQKQSQIMDLFHYLSLPSLISYKLVNRWVLFPKGYKYLLIDKFINKLLAVKKIKNGAALFFCLKNDSVSE